ncbi:MAG: hypothetical protein EZS28_035285 [Streblomastix strix]|uniref:Uncharacterized protein n=1 Tax=Streblomastix strix TaxID=222440 RepID=A0A5J4UF07_9EUKA|nr:MAG: hypothetical protein EZS28_035285 [Streblomastix strix]
MMKEDKEIGYILDPVLEEVPEQFHQHLDGDHSTLHHHYDGHHLDESLMYLLNETLAQSQDIIKFTESFYASFLRKEEF